MTRFARLSREYSRVCAQHAVSVIYVPHDLWKALPRSSNPEVACFGLAAVRVGADNELVFFHKDVMVARVDIDAPWKMKVVGFAGLAGSGKTTAAEALLNEAVEQHLSAAKLSFAAALRQICAIAYPWVPREYFCGNKTQKETQIPGMPEGITGRKILQRIGTDAFRNIYDQTWVRIIEYQIEDARQRGNMDLIVIDDVRFPNELEMLKRMGAVTLRCNREQPAKPPILWEDSEGNTVWVTPGIHESEAHIPTLPVDIDIDNNGTLDELRARVRSLLDT